jgi:hypothetical protein
MLVDRFGDESFESGGAAVADLVGDVATKTSTPAPCRPTRLASVPK